ncbi:MAG: tetratricopeptide repeat protein [Myxococcota bacterium]
MLAGLAVVLTVSLPAQATPTATPDSATQAEAEQFAAKAKDSFKARDFERSAKLFMQAYALSHEPALVYNAARAYEEAGMVGDAASLFRLYITLTNDADGILEARERIKRLEAKPGTSAPGAPPPAQVGPPANSSAITAPDTTVAASSSAPATWLKWTTTGTAGLSVLGGIALIATGRADAQDANDHPGRDEGAYGTAFDRAQTKWWAGVALTGVGVGLAGFATWLWLGEDGSKVAVVPTASGLGVAGRF